MTKKNILAAVAVIALLSSCKKSYTCECTEKSSMPGFEPETITVTTGKMKKSDAETACKNLEVDYETVDFSTGETYAVDETCSIK